MGTSLTGLTPSTTYDALIKVGDNGPISGTAKFLSDGLGNDTKLALSTSQVGIGTTSLSAWSFDALQVEGAAIWSSSNDLGLNSNSFFDGTNYIYRASSAAARLYFDTDGSAFFANAAAGTAGNAITFNERLKITSAGNVGIGTSAPSAKLSITDTANTSITVNTALTGTFPIKSGISFGAPSTALGGDSKYSGGAGIQGINIMQSDNVTDLMFWTTAGGSPSEKARITSDGFLRMASGSGGIQFNGDTSAANALDDYEEGTWTMSITFGGASVGVTTSVNTGTYTKIGRQVTVNGYLVLTNKGSSTGIAFLTGLPFAAGNTSANFAASSLWFNTITFTNQFQGRVNQNSNYIELEEITILGVASNLTDADFANNSAIMVSVTYFV